MFSFVNISQIIGFAPVKRLAGMIVSKMTSSVSNGALNHAQLHLGCIIRKRTIKWLLLILDLGIMGIMLATLAIIL